MAKKKTNKKLKYFLDHPQIKRVKSPGNGNTPEYKGSSKWGDVGKKLGGGTVSKPTIKPTQKTSMLKRTGKSSTLSSWKRTTPVKK